MTAEEVREHLTAFGLSETEVKVYLGVLRVGTATTGEIAEAADVSQGYVYEVVGTLSERGLVSIDESTSPTTIHALPPEEALSDLSERLSDLESAIEDTYEAGAGTAGFEIVHSRPTVRRRAVAALESAESEAVVVVPATEFEHLREALSAAVDRGVFVYLLLAAPDAAATAADIEHPGDYAHVLRTWEAEPPVFVLADEFRGVMGSHAILRGRHGEETALSFAQAEVGSGFFGNIVSNVWPMGTTRFVADPDPLPATYKHLRTAVSNAVLHRERGRELVADLLVEDTATGERATFEGVDVVALRQSLLGESTADFPMENSLVFESGGQQLSVGNRGGGIKPFLEDFAAIEVTLRTR